MYEKKEEGIIKSKKYFFLDDSSYILDSGKDSNTIYFFSSIISPTDVSATIIHAWQKYDEVKKEWVDHSRINYDIFGGREDGYRGYSNITNLSRGKWRVRVMVESRVVGIKNIEIK